MSNNNQLKVTIPNKGLSERVFWRKLVRFFAALNSNPDNNLTATELDILVEFLMLPIKFEHQLFGKVAKQKVRQACKKSGWEMSRMNLNNKIYGIEKKGYIVKDEDRINYLAPYLKKIWTNVKSSDSDNFTAQLSLVLQFDEQKASGDKKE